MTQFEGSDHLWEQIERYRHASLLRQLKTEFEFRRKTLPAPPLPLSEVPKEQPAQPDLGIVRKTVIRS